MKPQKANAPVFPSEACAKTCACVIASCRVARSAAAQTTVAPLQRRTRQSDVCRWQHRRPATASLRSRRPAGRNAQSALPRLPVLARLEGAQRGSSATGAPQVSALRWHQALAGSPPSLQPRGQRGGERTDCALSLMPRRGARSARVAVAAIGIARTAGRGACSSTTDSAANRRKRPITAGVLRAGGASEGGVKLVRCCLPRALRDGRVESVGGALATLSGAPTDQGGQGLGKVGGRPEGRKLAKGALPQSRGIRRSYALTWQESCV